MLDDEHYMDKWAEAKNDTSSRQHRNFMKLVYLFLLDWYQVSSNDMESQVQFQEGPRQQIFLVFGR